MSKRSHNESIGDGSDGVLAPASKRPKAVDSSDALEILLGKAEELISSIRELQAAKEKHKGPAGLKLGDLEDSAKTNITTLSQNLLPALQDLATATERESTKEEKSTKKEESTIKEDGVAQTIPSVGLVTKWRFQDIQPNLLPAIPKVRDRKMAVAALTHSGMTGSPSDPSYERLEWIGDAYLYIIASSLVYQTFPRMDPGKCSQYRELLVRNSTLAKYTSRYGLDKAANFPEEFGLGGRLGGTVATEKVRMKARGDIFEAYVAAIILSDPKTGVQRTCEWLKALWAPELRKEIQKEENTQAIPVTQVSSKTRLEQAIYVPGIKIEYRDLPTTKTDKRTGQRMFAIACILNGWGEKDKQLGFGCALSKKEAGQKAAQMALENKKMLKVYMDKKIAHNQARAAQEAEENAKAAVKEEENDKPAVKNEEGFSRAQHEE
ncbi:Ribonuclease III domain containing protein [Naviculisporaceae sp. PSN 640]